MSTFCLTYDPVYDSLVSFLLRSNLPVKVKVVPDVVVKAYDPKHREESSRANG